MACVRNAIHMHIHGQAHTALLKLPAFYHFDCDLFSPTRNLDTFSTTSVSAKVNTNYYQTHHQPFAVIRLFFFSKINACTHRVINRFSKIWAVAVKHWSNSIARLTNL